jgi:hypothetical protein
VSDYNIQALDSEGEWYTCAHCGSLDDAREFAKDYSSDGERIYRVRWGVVVRGVYVKGKLYQ